MADKNVKLLHWDESWYLVVFGVADYEFELNIQKFEIADPKWWTQMQKVECLGWYFVHGSFCGSWLRTRA